MTFGRYLDPQIRGWVRQVATEETDPNLRTLAQTAIRPAIKQGES
jgi:hypothetical protein